MRCTKLVLILPRWNSDGGGWMKSKVTFLTAERMSHCKLLYQIWCHGRQNACGNAWSGMQCYVVDAIARLCYWHAGGCCKACFLILSVFETRGCMDDDVDHTAARAVVMHRSEMCAGPFSGEWNGLRIEASHIIDAVRIVMLHWWYWSTGFVCPHQFCVRHCCLVLFWES